MQVVDKLHLVYRPGACENTGARIYFVYFALGRELP
jgi:hypothetical protein